MTEELQPLAGVSLERAIRLRWALRDIKAKRTQLTPVSSEDLQTLIELGLIEMSDKFPSLLPTARELSTENPNAWSLGSGELETFIGAKSVSVLLGI